VISGSWHLRARTTLNRSAREQNATERNGRFFGGWTAAPYERFCVRSTGRRRPLTSIIREVVPSMNAMANRGIWYSERDILAQNLFETIGAAVGIYTPLSCVAGSNLSRPHTRRGILLLFVLGDDVASQPTRYRIRDRLYRDNGSQVAVGQGI